MLNTTRLLRPQRTAVLQLWRQISLDKLSNKKVYRLESDIELTDSEFRNRLINRNPRNLEQSLMEHKPTGFWLEKSPPTDWNTVVFEQSGGEHSVAYLQSWSGKRLVSVSTAEPQLGKYFRSPNTRQAAIILGKVLSRRCLQSGYLCAGIRGSFNDLPPKTQAFLQSLVSEGFTLEEPKEIEPRSNSDV